MQQTQNTQQRTVDIRLHPISDPAPGMVSALVEINGLGPCAHKKRYAANARMSFRAGVNLRRGLGTVNVELAPTRVIPPGWINCPAFDGQPLEAGAHGALRMEPGESSVMWGNDSFVGKPSLSVEYRYSTRKTGTAASLSQPFRALWAGQSAVLTDRGESRFAGSGLAITAVVRMTFTRRS